MTPAKTIQLPLHACSEELLSDPDSAATWLRLADKHIQTLQENPQGFVLPRQLMFLKPLLEAYTDDLEGFVQYLAGIRDSIPKDSPGWKDMHALYRKVLGRHIQQVRRHRVERAVAKAEELYGEVDFHTRLKWAADLEHEWAQRRLEFLSDRRERTPNNRLSFDEQAEMLSIFWDEIDTEITRGGVPPWNSRNLGATQL